MIWREYDANTDTWTTFNVEGFDENDEPIYKEIILEENTFVWFRKQTD